MTNGVQAFLEWTPIRAVDTNIYRTFQFGKLAELYMLEDR
jgi:phosphodiesterase/alkaline phosphatase D-like protein